MSRVLAVVVAVVMVASACSSRAETEILSISHPLFGTTERLSEIVGTDIRSSQVVAMQCIPSRVDPVGVWLELEIVDWLVTDEEFAVRLRTSDSRLGSHPSGCSDPSPDLEQSMFLLGPGDQTVLASYAEEIGDTTDLIFELGDLAVESLSAVLLPTLEFTAGGGERQTTIFGLMGFYQLA